MNKKDKELAIKIVDFYFSKCKTSKLCVFPRTTDSHYFGLNCIIGKTEYYLRFNNMMYHAATFKSRCDVNKLKRLDNLLSFAEINLSSNMSCWPKFLKMAVIEECLSKNEDLLATNIVSFEGAANVIVIPAAKSLEELAIKMELEQ